MLGKQNRRLTQSRSIVGFIPFIINRQFKDNLPAHIRGAAHWNEDNNTEGYQVYDLLSQTYLEVEYDEDNRQWYFIQQDSRSCRWVATQPVPSQYNLRRQSIAPSTVAAATVNDTETGHNQSSTAKEHNQSLSMATQTMPAVMAAAALTLANTKPGKVNHYSDLAVDCQEDLEDMEQEDHRVGPLEDPLEDHQADCSG
jgi:hypothetical protein